MRNLLLFHVNNKEPDLTARCRQLSFELTLSECLSWSHSNKSKNNIKNDAKIKFDYCSNIGHSIIECRKRKKAEKVKPSHGKDKNDSILPVNKMSDNIPYQLDTAASCHASGNESDFSSYTKCPQTLFVAGGGQVTASGHGDLLLSRCDEYFLLLNLKLKVFQFDGLQISKI